MGYLTCEIESIDSIKLKASENTFLLYIVYGGRRPPFYCLKCNSE